MAIVSLSSLNAGNVQYVTWAALANGDTGQPLESAKLSDKTAQIFGTFGAGGSITLQGSNDPRVLSAPSSAVWVDLTDTTETALTFTTASGAQILQNYRFIRPTVTAGDGTTALTVVLCSKGC